MEAHHFFLHLMAILLGARLLSELATRLGLPSVIGELCAGVLLGPSLLGWLSPNEVIHLLAEIGIILLLFEVGLETDVERLLNAGRQSIVVALSGFILPFLLGFSLTYFIFGLPLLVSLFIGGTLTATSIGITVRVLADLGRQHSPEGQIVLGAAVLDDVLGVVLLALLYDFSINGGVSLTNAGAVLLFVSLFFVLAPLAARLLSSMLSYVNSLPHNPGLIPTTVVALVLFFAWLAHLVGAPELLGGFAAGLALSRRFFLPFGASIRHDTAFAHSISEQMQPIIYLFTPIFFVMVGLSLNLKEIDWSSGFIWIFSLSMLLVAFVGKFLGAWLLKTHWKTRTAVGIAMVPRGEVGLIFAELGRTSGILNNELYAGLIIVIAITTLSAPLLMKWFYHCTAETTLEAPQINAENDKCA